MTTAEYTRQQGLAPWLSWSVARAQQMTDTGCIAVATKIMLRAGLTALILLGVAVICALSEAGRHQGNSLIPLGLAAISLWSGYSLLKASKLFAWSAVFWFMVAVFLSSGFAPLLYVWANPQTIAYVNGYYDLTEDLLFRTNLLNAVSFTIVSFGSAAALHVAARWRVKTVARTIGSERAAAWVFLTIGLPVKYLLVVPYEFGFSDWVLPGALSHLSMFCTIALIVLFAMRKRGNAYLVAGIVLFCLELVTAFVSLAKSNIILALLALTLGLFLSSQKLRILVIGFLVTVFLYVAFLQGFIDFARDRLGRERSVVRVVDALNEYADGARLPDDDIQGWWSRQSVANAQGFAIDAYDSGNRGHSLDAILIALIPRIFWPDKPIITIGAEFNFMVNGNPTSASTPGVFGEAYWNGGWLTVVGVAIYVGAVLACMTSISLYRMGRGDFIFLPIVFYGITCGISIAGWFVPTYIGGLGSAAMLYVLTKFMFDRRLRRAS